MVSIPTTTDQCIGIHPCICGFKYHQSCLLPFFTFCTLCDNSFMFSWCENCMTFPFSTVHSLYTKVSIDSLLFSFVKFLELKFYSVMYMVLVTKATRTRRVLTLSTKTMYNTFYTKTSWLPSSTHIHTRTPYYMHAHTYRNRHTSVKLKYAEQITSLVIFYDSNCIALLQIIMITWSDSTQIMGTDQAIIIMWGVCSRLSIYMCGCS